MSDTLTVSPSLDEKPFLRGSSVMTSLTARSYSVAKIELDGPHLYPDYFAKEDLKGPGSSDVLRPPRPIDSINPSRYPTPPPLDNLEGSTAVHPYISKDAYSTRSSGPKLYDILNELSLEPFDLMSWYIIDREEDLFELDYMRDEDKVMLALWGRWIFLNRYVYHDCRRFLGLRTAYIVSCGKPRSRFIEDYGRGIKLFIDEYWIMIHRAAGVDALRI